MNDDAREAVQNSLNDLGKDLDARFFKSLQSILFSLQTQYSGVNQEHDSMKSLMGGLTFVYDANAVQRVMRRALKYKLPHDLLESAKSGFIAPIAPKDLDDEIAEHAGRMARSCKVSVEEVLKNYIWEVRPYLRLMDVQNAEILNDIKATMRDVDDAPYISVFFERESIGVVSEDNGVKNYLGEKAFSVKDICDINIIYRKQYVILNISVINLVMFLALVGLVVKMIAKVWRYILGGALLAIGVIFLIRVLSKETYDEIMESIKEKTGAMKEGFSELWKAVSPFLVAYLEEFAQRNTEFHEKVESLTQNGKHGITRQEKTEKQLLSYVSVVKMILLAMKNRPMREKDILKVFKTIGYHNQKGNNLRTGIRRALKTNPLFMRLENGYYQLA